MISNILILLILLYLAIRMLALIALIFRRLNRNRNLTQIESSLPKGNADIMSAAS